MSETLSELEGAELTSLLFFRLLGSHNSTRYCCRIQCHATVGNGDLPVARFLYDLSDGTVYPGVPLGHSKWKAAVKARELSHLRLLDMITV